MPGDYVEYIGTALPIGTMQKWVDLSFRNNFFIYKSLILEIYSRS